jgi:glycosyltransferase involved in cell wall biosynthesis
MILMYHKVSPEPKTMWWVTPDAFYLQMHDLRSKKVVHLDEYDPQDPDQCVITFDGVYENVWKYAVPILKYFGYPFEMFIVGQYIGKDNQFDAPEPLAKFASKEILARMVQAGGRLQWHTWSHQLLPAPQSKETYERELSVPKDLRALCPQGFKWFAYPHGKRDEAYISQVKQHFSGALASDDENAEDRYNLGRMTIQEKTRFTTSTISVIIPCYNYGHLLAEAIESVLYQTYPPDEILVIDDASSDNSVEVARRYAPQVRVEVNEKNLGIIGNFKKAVGLTSGDFISLLGADNRFRSDYIEKTKEILDGDPKVAIAYTHFVLFDKLAPAEAARTGGKTHSLFPEFFLKEFPAHPQRSIVEENFVHGSSMYRRTAYEQVGGYKEGNMPEDHSLFARMLENGWKAKLADEFLLEYRQHSREQANQLKSLEIENAYLRKQYYGLINQSAEPGRSLVGAEQTLANIYSTRAWRMVERFWKLKAFLLPKRNHK